MIAGPAKLALGFSSVGHTYTHLFTAFYFTVVLALDRAWPLSYAELLALWTPAAIIVGAGALPAGWLADRMGAIPMMIVLFIGMGAMSVIAGFCNNATSLLVALAGIGLFAAVYHPVGLPWLIRNAPPHVTGKLLALNGIFGAAGIASAALVAGALIDLAGWRAAFIAPGLISIATGLMMAFAWATGRLAEGPAVARESAAQAAAARSERWRVLLVLMFAMAAGGLIYQSMQTAMPKIFDERLEDLFGTGIFGVGAAVAVVYAIAGATQLIGGHLADRYPLKQVYLLGWLVQVPFLWLAALYGGPLLVGLVTTVLATNATTMAAENMLLARNTPSHRQGLMFGVKFVIAFGAAPIGIYLVALMQTSSYGFYGLFLILAGLAAAITLAATLLPGRQPRTAPAMAE